MRGRASLVLAVGCVWRGIRVGIFEGGVSGVVGGPEAGVLEMLSAYCSNMINVLSILSNPLEYLPGAARS